MRVTQLMMSQRFLADLQENMRLLEGKNEQLSNGKRINRPSDDPVGIGQSMALRSQVEQSKQYRKNAQNAGSLLDSTEGALNELSSVLTRASELGVQGANDTLSSASRQALAREVDELFRHTVQVANTDVGGRYIFGGYRTTQRPYTPVGSFAPVPAYGGDNGAIEYELGAGNKIAVNVTGPDAFADVFGGLTALRDALQANDTAAISGALGTVSAAGDHVLEVRAEVGARMNRLERTTERLDLLDESLKKVLSTVEDADMAEVITELKTRESVYRASLAAGSRLLQPTLMDFLR